MKQIKTILFSSLVLAFCVVQISCGQSDGEDSKNQSFPFTQEFWTIENSDGSKSEIKSLEHKGKQALLLEASQTAYLKVKKFKNFVMEFYCNGNFPGLGFRILDNKNYEYLYLRVPMSDKRDALQYVPIYNGSLPWQLYNYPKYEGNATFPKVQVATLPLSFEDQLVKGKASKKLLEALKGVEILFSEESLIDFADETTPYIYDPQTQTGLLIEKSDSEIAFLDFRTWIHTKVEVEANKMSVYIENMDTPTFVVDNLKRYSEEGGISLISDFDQVYFSDFSISEIKLEGQSKNNATEKSISPNYLTQWNVSEMFTKDSINFTSQVDSLFKNKAKFKTIEADDDGLLNISRFYDDMTKTVALTCDIVSDSDKTVKLKFDYADHLVILSDSKILFDKGMNFQPPPEKGEEGRVFVGDEQIDLKLSKGNNELIFLLSADNRQKFNWGFIAQLESLDGITIE